MLFCFLQWLRLISCFVVIDTPWASDLSKWSFIFVTTIFKSVIFKIKALVHTQTRSRSAWHTSIGIPLGKTSLVCPFPTFYQVQQTTTFCAGWAEQPSCPHCPDRSLPVTATESFISTNCSLVVLPKFIFSSSAWCWSSK